MPYFTYDKYEKQIIRDGLLNVKNFNGWDKV